MKKKVIKQYNDREVQNTDCKTTSINSRKWRPKTEVQCIKESNTEYEKYLQSEHWQTLKNLVKQYYENRCAVCNKDEYLQVHHRTYERKGKEKLQDLILLCRDCHKKFHNIGIDEPLKEVENLSIDKYKMKKIDFEQMSKDIIKIIKIGCLENEIETLKNDPDSFEKILEFKKNTNRL